MKPNTIPQTNTELLAAWNAYQLNREEREMLDDAMQQAGPEGIQAMFRNGATSQVKMIKYTCYLDVCPDKWKDIPLETARMLARCSSWVVNQERISGLVQLYMQRLRSKLQTQDSPMP